MGLPADPAPRPGGLLQEEFADDPWKMIVGCVLLNQTSRRQVDRVIDELFDTWPTPRAMSDADQGKLEDLIRPLGFQRKRAQTLIELSQRWDALENEIGPRDWDPETISDLPGVGPYALDSYRIFHLGDFSRCDSGDKEIMAWLAREDLL